MGTLVGLLSIASTSRESMTGLGDITKTVDPHSSNLLDIMHGFSERWYSKEVILRSQILFNSEV
jgi:hypothetical protein